MTIDNLYYDALGDAWWDPEGPMGLLLRMNRLRYQYFRSVLGEPKGVRLLDIGCGGGFLANAFAEAGAEVYGLDLTLAQQLTIVITATLASIGLRGPDWFGHPIIAKITVILADSWQFTPFMMLVLYAGLQSLDRNILEAADIDGASGWSKLWHVILPALRPLILFVLAIRLMDAFRFFDLIYVLTGGGPGSATETLTIYAYSLGFRLLEIGKASALGVMTLIVSALMIGGIILVLYRKERGAF